MALRSRLVAATTRTSTARVLVPPTRSNFCVSRTRRSLTWVARLISPISSRKRVPPSASSKRPGTRSVAPVKAPFSCPKSSASRRLSLREAQWTAMKGPSARGLRRWTACATSSFPVPLSPVTRTVVRAAATCRTWAMTSCMTWERPMMPGMAPSGSAASPSAEVPRRRARTSSPFLSMASRLSRSTGLER